MKIWNVAFLCLASALGLSPLFAADPRENIVVLDTIAVENLGIETVVAERRLFEETTFAIGRLEEVPAQRAVLSSRIPGRVTDVRAFLGDRVTQGQVLVRVESRQPGNPPPSIELRAPRSGVIVDSHVRLGQPVTPDHELLDIGDRSVLWATAKIPEAELAKISPGMPARIRIPAAGNKRLVAPLVRYGIEADREAGTVDGIFELPNPDGSLQPGMRVEFSIVTSYRENVLSIPREAVQGDPTKRVLFVKDYEIPNAYVPFPVVLGEENDEFVEVVRGIFPHDEIVTKGSYSLAFAGGSGMSLKEALDAAHGHEHNEDGSEMTPEQRAAKQREKEGGGGSGLPTKVVVQNKPLVIYAAVVTGLALLFLQQLWNRKRKRQLSPPPPLEEPADHA